MEKRPPRRMVVLWRWNEAENSEGEYVTGSVGGHMKYARKGDVLYLCAISGTEVHLLGSLLLKTVGREKRAAARRAFGPYRATGMTRFGPFGIFPLRALKWQLRFEHGQTQRLSRNTPLGLQLRSRRYITKDSARLLDEVLKERRDARTKAINAIRNEGKRLIRAMSVRERNPAVRRDAIRRYGRRCQICAIDMKAKYGAFAADCIEVHHLDPLGERSARGGRTGLDDVIVVCPNCHRALHSYDDPTAWRRLRAACEFE